MIIERQTRIIADTDFLWQDFHYQLDCPPPTNQFCRWMLLFVDDTLQGFCSAEMVDTDVWRYREMYIHPKCPYLHAAEDLHELRADLISKYKPTRILEHDEPYRSTEKRFAMTYAETHRDYVEGSNEGLVGPINSLVGFWPYPETDEHTWQYVECSYRALACTYQMDMQLVSEPEEIIIGDKRPWVSIEEYREGVPSTPYTEFEYPEEAVYLMGSSKHRHPSDIFEVDHIVTVPTPGGYAEPLYACQAAAIVFQDRYIRAQAAPTADLYTS